MMVNLIKVINAPLKDNEIIQNAYPPIKKNIALTISNTLLGHTQDNIKDMNKHLTIVVGLSLNTIRLMLGTSLFQVQ
jgi:hypothetical protein